jgi:hypothetical protein
VKTEGQIKQKAKQVVFRHRKEYIRQGLAKRPENCLYNEEVRLPVHMANRATIHVCGYRSEGCRNDVVCDSTMGGDRQAQECPYFQIRRGAEALKDEFNGRISRGIGYLAKAYPDVAALMWVMGPGKEESARGPEVDPESRGNILAFFGDQEEPEDLPERPLVEEPNVDSS